jgi:hypothetical protein
LRLPAWAILLIRVPAARRNLFIIRSLSHLYLRFSGNA